MTDKVERADYTSTLSCTSKYHRYFSKIVKFDPPCFQLEQLVDRLKEEKQGIRDSALHQFGWSTDFVHRTANGGRFPSCYGCRKRNVDALRQNTTLVDNQCECCGNWTLSERTKERLSFLPPANYPLTQIPNCPVDPPVGREVGLERLSYMDVQFPTMVQATRYAFANSMTKRGTGWNKTHCIAYLRSCGINGKHQASIYEHAKKAYNDQIDIDWNHEESVGGYVFPAAWTGDLAIQGFIEMLMHLLFLGVAESNFTLCNKYLLDAGRPVETFKKTVQLLLKDLTVFNLSWLLVLPFSGSTKTKLTTGTWVSENWLGWTRITKIVYSYCCRRGINDERIGANDVNRMTASFTAMVARILSHSGMAGKDIERIDMLVKEFLSCVRELDIRVRHKAMNSLGSAGTGDADTGDRNRDQWWLKSNYISCLNLKRAAEQLGPLTNWWDGGGRGERFIQVVKLWIPRGIREGGLFFVRLGEKVYKNDAMKRIEEEHCSPVLFDLTNEDESLDSDSGSESSDTLEASSVANLQPPVSTINVTQDGDDEPDSDIETGQEDGDGQLATEEEERWSTPMEDEQMNKARTYFIYKNITAIQDAIDNNKPVSGVLLKAADGGAGMYLIYKKPAKQFGWMTVSFHDDAGVTLCGLWCAPIIFSEAESPPTSIKQITKLAKMATVAIPLHYTLGRDHDHSYKYCVITNWWRERNREGRYVFPSLAFDMYRATEETNAT